MTPIVDLCHFGVPDWIGNFQNSDWPKLFAEYAEAFAHRLPVGSVLHSGERDLYRCHLFRNIDLVHRRVEANPGKPACKRLGVIRNNLGQSLF